MDEIPIIEENIAEFVHNEKLTDVAMIDFRHSEMYKKLHFHNRLRPDRLCYLNSAQFAPNIFLRYNVLMFALKDRTSILKHPFYYEELPPSLLSAKSTDDPEYSQFIFKFSRLYDFILGFTVENASNVEACKVIFALGKSIVNEIDFSDEFKGEDQVHICFTSSLKQQVQRFTLDLEEGSFYNFCTGIPICVLQYNEVYIEFTTKGSGDRSKPVVIPDISYLGSNLRNELIRSFRTSGKTLRVQLGKHTCYVYNGSVLTPFTNNKHPYLDFLVDNFNSVMNKDELFVLDSFVY
jgi:hypothetical protein